MARLKLPEGICHITTLNTAFPMPTQFFLDEGEAATMEACMKVEAQIRLLLGQVLVAGYIDPITPNVVTWFSASDTKKVFDMETTTVKASAHSLTFTSLIVQVFYLCASSIVRVYACACAFRTHTL